MEPGSVRHTLNSFSRKGKDRRHVKASIAKSELQWFKAGFLKHCLINLFNSLPKVQDMAIELCLCYFTMTKYYP